MILFKTPKLLDFLFPAIIFILWAFVVLTNFTPNTYLTGWDNLHPEFNFGLNIMRNLSATWQEYQGVGLLGGMAHAADLPRQIMLWLFSLILPNNLLRWSWTLLMLLIGPLGVYYFLKNVLSSRLAGFGAAVFYLFNLATVQYFYTPFEAFITFYGAFPWLIYLAYKYLRAPKKHNLAIFLLISLLSTTAFYVQTLFVVYALVLGSLVLSSLVFGKTKFKNVLTLGLGTLAINAFWLLPVAYFALTGSGVVASNKSNLIATPETRLMNQGFGDPQSIASLKGFWLEYTDFQDGGFGYLMPIWHDWAQTSTYSFISLGLFVAAVLGLAISLPNKKFRSFSVFVVSTLVFSALLLSAGQGVLGVFYKTLSKFVPLFAEMFRSPFTKWSIPLGFAISLGLGLFIKNIFKLNKFIGILGVILISIFSVYQVKPVLEGHLIHQELKQEIPNAYFDLFEFFESEPTQSRIARFPVQNFWGWDFYGWQYRGSGLLWYGIRQPILDRAFDVWSRENEEYYWQVRNAVYEKDPVALKNVFQKYQIKYALLDESVIVAGANDQDVLMFDETKQLLFEIGAEKVFERDFLSVYELSNVPEKFVFAPQNYAFVDTVGFGSRADKAFSEYGAYISDSDSSIIFPFWDLNSEEPTNISIESGFGGDRLKIKRSLGLKGNYKLVVPDLDKIKVGTQVSYSDQQLKLDFLLPKLKIQDHNISFTGNNPVYLTLNQDLNQILVSVNNEISEELQNGQSLLLSNIGIFENSDVAVSVFNAGVQPRTVTDSLLTAQFNTCWEREGSEGSFEITTSGDQINIKTQDQVACASMPLVRNLQIDSILEFSLPFKSESGASPHFCIVEEGENDCLNSEVYYQTPTSTSWTQVSRKVFLQSGKSYWAVVAGRPPEQKGELWEISYKQPEFKLMPLVAAAQVEPEVVPMLGSKLIFDLDLQKDEFELNFPLVGQEIDFVRQGRAEPKNCDLFERGEVDKEVVDSQVLYSASSWGASCDYVNTEISTKWEYLLQLTGRNLSGRSEKAYLYNPALKINELEVLVGKDIFSEIYALGGWKNYEENSYVLNIETRSFGPNKSENILGSAQFYNLPISWLAAWQLIPDSKTKHQNYLTVESVSKYGTFLYKVQTRGEGVLALSQGRNKGWMTYPKLEHYEFNSWANAWEVPQGEYTIYVFYWPQLLQFIGFGVLLLTIIAILI